jgi:hypothetical protein
MENNRKRGSVYYELQHPQKKKKEEIVVTTVCRE